MQRQEVKQLRKTRKILVVATRRLDIESPRLHREIENLDSMGFEVASLEPIAVYMGEGYRSLELRPERKSLSYKVQRNYSSFFTLPAADWLAKGSAMKKTLFFVIQPVLLSIGLWLLLLKLIRLISDLKPSLIIVHGAPDLGAIAVRLIAPLFQVPYIYEERDPAALSYSILVEPFSLRLSSIVERLLEHTESFILKGSTLVITVGASLSRRLRSKFAVSKSLIIYSSTPSVPLPTHIHESKQFRIALSGAIEGRLFELDSLIWAVSELRNLGYDAKLVIIGVLSSDLASKIDAFSEVVDLVKWMAPGDYVQFLSKECDAGIIPLKPTKFTRIVTPNKLFDYMSAGLPVIVPSLPGVEEVVRESVNGYVYAAGSKQSLLESLIRCINDKDRFRLGREAFREFNGEYCEEIQMDKFRDAVTRIVDKSSRN